MSKCGEKTEIYSRVCGYFRPVSNWNKGKKAEFKERKTFDLSKNAVSALLVALCALTLMTGCKTSETLAAGITTKNLTGNGTVVVSHIGIAPETKTPELKSTFVSGDFATVKSGTNAVTYREEKTASVFNAKSVTSKRFLAITLTDCADVPAVIAAVSKVLKNSAKVTPKNK